MRMDGQTDMTKLIVAFRNFANAPKLKHSNLERSEERFINYAVSCRDYTSVGAAGIVQSILTTYYGLNRPRIESRWASDFPYSSRPPLGPTQHPVQ